ncbi:triose-phosphate isomerase [Ruminococcus gauvreauii]|uniref:Triose-phosphate isomerase n=1 Tax=Ruminococcus gauvreauii TaxID=438033 RepID=A0ABY5VEW7_9FIRM|nr:triose-phosphate isomerase [Ruminococcus gauvreauii]UWP58811.1 triose-phosphate isomerase [Ruminococcus gauvreauii]
MEKKRKVRTPFFVVNPKSYLYGQESLALAKYADELAGQYDIDVFFTGQLVDLALVRKETKRLIVTAQHMDGLLPGRGMGHVLPDALVNAGIQAVFLNHAECPLTLSQLAKAMARGDELGILTIVCADTVEEAMAIAKLHPDIMVCEPTSLIGTGQVSDEKFMKDTNEAVKALSPDTLVLQAAGISTAKDVYRAIVLGADGTGATSGIVAAKDPFAALAEMMEAMGKAKEDIGRKTI